MRSTAHDAGVATGDGVLGTALSRAVRGAALSAYEERRLARLALRGDRRARDRLIESHVRLVVAIARGYRGRGVAHADLVQDGLAGLLQAIDGFDPDRGYRLATYATWWIRRAMLRSISTAPLIRVPDDGQRDLAKILRHEQELRRAGRACPTSDALSEATGLPVSRVELLRSAARVVASLDAPVSDDDTTLGEIVPDVEVVDASAGLLHDETRHRVLEALRLLEPRMQQILRLRFGLDGTPPRTYKEIGECVGLTAERTRQVEAQALLRLRAVATRCGVAA